MFLLFWTSYDTVEKNDAKYFASFYMTAYYSFEKKEANYTDKQNILDNIRLKQYIGMRVESLLFDSAVLLFESQWIVRRFSETFFL